MAISMTPELEQKVSSLAREIGNALRAGRKARGEKQFVTCCKLGFTHHSRVSQIERAGDPNMTLAVALRCLELEGKTLAVVPKVAP